MQLELWPYLDLIMYFKKGMYLILTLRTLIRFTNMKDPRGTVFLYLGAKGCTYTVSVDEKKGGGANSKTAAFEIKAKRLLLTVEV